MKKRQPIVKDERTKQLDGKVTGEMVLLFYILLLFSMLVKYFVFRLPVLSMLPELVILVGVGLYALVRRLILGVDIRDMVVEEGLKETIISALIFAVITVGFDLWPHLHDLSKMLTPALLVKLVILVIIWIVGRYTLDKIALWVNHKRQNKLEKDLDD